MPPVFGGSSNTITDYEDIEFDNLLPPSGALDLKTDGIAAIKAVHGHISGAAGVDAKIIHGASWEDVDGNQGTVITGTENRHTILNLKRYIDQNETKTVGGDWSLTIAKNARLTVSAGGSFTENQFGPVNRFFVMPVTEVYQADLSQQIPDSFLGSAKLFDNNWVAATQTNIVSGLETELISAHVEIGNYHAELKMMHPEVKLIKAYFYEADAGTGLLEAVVKAFKGAIGTGADVKAKVNAGPSVGVITPFR